MDTASQVLLIIVSATLAVFLVVAIFALIAIIRVARRVEDVVQKAENVAGSVQAAASAFEKASAPLAFMKVVSSIISSVKRKDK